MGESLPETFDVLVVGTGLVESIVSAAVSRNGHTVLHIDPRDYYGGMWATMSLAEWSSGEFAASPTKVIDAHVEGELNLTWHNQEKDFEEVWYNADSQAELKSLSRKFNIDVFAKVLMTREEVIQLLIDSNVSRYMEFLRVGSLITNLPNLEKSADHSLIPIPLSRSDIFKSKIISLKEKRELMRLIEAVMKPREPSADDSSSSPPSTFSELAEACGLSARTHSLIHTISEVTKDIFESPEEVNNKFIERSKVFLESIGRYGNPTPFLWPLYGISEACQAFCRLSAVYGGIFILKRFINSITINEENNYVVKSEDDSFTVKNIVLGPELTINLDDISSSSSATETSKIGRAVLLTKGGPMKPNLEKMTNHDGISMYIIDGVEIIELSSVTHSVPENFYLLHVTFSWSLLEGGDHKGSIKTFVETLLSPFLRFQSTMDSGALTEAIEPSSIEAPAQDSPMLGKPTVIYGSYFSILFNNFPKPSFSSVFTCDVNSTILNNHVAKAKEIFSQLYPDEEFLPRAPDAGEENEDDNEEEEVSDPTDENNDVEKEKSKNDDNVNNSGDEKSNVSHEMKME